MPCFYLLGVFTVKKKPTNLDFFSYFPEYSVTWKCVFSLIYMNAIWADVLPSRMFQLVAFGIIKWYKGAEYLDFSSPDPPGGLGTMLQTLLLCLTLWVTRKWPLWAAGRWPPAVLLLGLSAVGDGSKEMGRQGSSSWSHTAVQVCRATQTEIAKNVFRRDLLAETEYSEQGGAICNCMFGQIWWHWEQFTNKEAEPF